MQITVNDQCIDFDSNDFLYSWKIAESTFSAPEFTEPGISASIRGAFTIQELHQMSTGQLNTSPREYQREKVATILWKQELLRTVLIDKVAKIPELHIRVITKDRAGKVFSKSILELLDGQQRATTLIDFINNEFQTGDLPSINGYDLSNKFFKDLDQSIRDKIFDYTLGYTAYINITDNEARRLFIDVLNNTNSLEQVEKRNAERGPLAEFVRNNARFDTRHVLFSTIIENGEEKLKFFDKSFKIGRMQTDLWLQRLLYLNSTGKSWNSCASEGDLNKWYRVTNSENGIYSTDKTEEWINDKKKFEDTINYAKQVITNVCDEDKVYLTPTKSLVLVSVCMQKKRQYGKVAVKAFTKKFFETFKLLSNLQLKKFEGFYYWNAKGQETDEPIPPFDKLFGGHNAKNLTTIRNILDTFIDSDLSGWGITEIDSTQGGKFTKKQLQDALFSQGNLDYYTGLPLSMKDAEADHIKAKSKGGLTHQDNLGATHRDVNQLKSDKDVEEFIPYLHSQGYPIAERFHHLIPVAA